MNEDDIKYINKSDGWEIGVGPTITIIDKGMANSFTTTTAREGVYAFFFEQKGLMAGLGVQGTKISRIDPNS
jgi:lipid-binding SYLF domain-containing protein